MKVVEQAQRNWKSQTFYDPLMYWTLRFFVSRRKLGDATVETKNTFREYLSLVNHWRKSKYFEVHDEIITIGSTGSRQSGNNNAFLSPHGLSVSPVFILSGRILLRFLCAIDVEFLIFKR